MVRKDELHQRLWQETFVSDATLVGLIKKVRRALNDELGPSVVTFHGSTAGMSTETTARTPL